MTDPDDDSRRAEFLLAARSAKSVTIPGGKGLLIGENVYKITGPAGTTVEVQELFALALRSCVLG